MWSTKAAVRSELDALSALLPAFAGEHLPGYRLLGKTTTSALRIIKFKLVDVQYHRLMFVSVQSGKAYHAIITAEDGSSLPEGFMFIDCLHEIKLPKRKASYIMESI